MKFVLGFASLCTGENSWQLGFFLVAIASQLLRIIRDIEKNRYFPATDQMTG
ncbi:MAG: hypothetical protein HRU40_15855 [Saprospiraceae bacterium]|nr:hypothetical protein [Saprospiraceae bacterium]